MFCCSMFRTICKAYSIYKRTIVKISISLVNWRETVFTTMHLQKANTDKFDQSYVKWVGTTAQLFAKFTQLISNLTLLYSMLLIKIQKNFLDWLCYISSKETTFPSRIFDEIEAFWYFLAIFQFWPYSKRSPKVKFEDVKKQRVVVPTIWFFRLRTKPNA